MSRSLSWINQQELDSLLTHMGFAQKGAVESGTSRAPDGKPPQEPGPSPAATDTSNPFDRRARQVRQAVSRHSPAVANAPKEPTLPPLLPLSEPGIAGLLLAKSRWESHAELPMAPEDLVYPHCFGSILRWLLSTTEGVAGFIADEEGLALASHGVDESHISISASFAQTRQLLEITSSQQATRALRSAILPMPHLRHWHLGWIESAIGPIAWGIQTPQYVSLELITSASTMLETLLNHTATYHASNRS